MNKEMWLTTKSTVQTSVIENIIRTIKAGTDAVRYPSVNLALIAVQLCRDLVLLIK